MSNCSCGTKTTEHSIFCSGSFYKDPMSEKKYKSKQPNEKQCNECFLLFDINNFKKNSNICNECT